jgi:hypothetical protein
MTDMSNLNPDQFDYRMSHRPAGPGEDVGAQFHRADEVMPDVTGPKGEQYYDHHAFAAELGPARRVPYSQSPSAETFAQMRAAKDNPDHEVRIYRSVPKVEHGIQPGDWVTPSRKYAEQHGRQETADKDWPVVEGTAKASELYGHGDDPNEWGYHPQNRGRA